MTVICRGALTAAPADVDDVVRTNADDGANASDPTAKNVAIAARNSENDFIFKYYNIIPVDDSSSVLDNAI